MAQLPLWPPVSSATIIKFSKGGNGEIVQYAARQHFKMTITKKEWGIYNNQALYLFTLENEHGNSVSISNLGGIIVSIIMPDRTGQKGDVVLGFDTAEEYIDDRSYIGAMIGRYANRISNATFTLNNQVWPLTPNQNGNTLHGGSGFHKKIWDYSIANNSLVLKYHSPHLEDGFPGNLDIEITYTLSDSNALTIDTRAISDLDTVCSITNHSYFNLSGHGTTRNHKFSICASQYTPCDETLIPTGQILSVKNTDLDYRAYKLLANPKTDINFVLDEDHPFSASAYDPESGRKLIVHSSLPCLQFYTAGGMSPRRGKAAQIYGPNSGFCFEPQHFPDAPNIPAFPSAVLKKGNIYSQKFIYQFCCEN